MVNRFSDMNGLLKILGRFFAGLGSVFVLSPFPYRKYPFTFPEKALTSDWMSLGKDINVVINREDNAHDE